MKKAVYEAELLRLQAELVKMQEWVQHRGPARRGRLRGPRRRRQGRHDQADHRSTSTPASPGSPRCPRPTERERSQWYFQRYVEHLPAAGEIVLFDRSWYNRAGVERVMGFCTPEEYRRFLHQCPIFERLLVEDGILLRKYWFSVSDEEQERRFQPAAEGPDAAVEALPDGPGVDHPLGGLLPRQGRDVRAHRHPRGALVRRRERRQAARADQHDRPPALDASRTTRCRRRR